MVGRYLALSQNFSAYATILLVLMLLRGMMFLAFNLCKDCANSSPIICEARRSSMARVRKIPSVVGGKASAIS